MSRLFQSDSERVRGFVEGLVDFEGFSAISELFRIYFEPFRRSFDALRHFEALVEAILRDFEALGTSDGEAFDCSVFVRSVFIACQWCSLVIIACSLLSDPLSAPVLDVCCLCIAGQCLSMHCHCCSLRVHCFSVFFCACQLCSPLCHCCVMSAH